MIISLSVLVITIIVSGTYALYKAQLSKNIGVNTTTHGLAYYINYVKGTDITAATLNPSTSYESGASSDIEFWKKDDSYDIYGKIDLTVNTIGTNLKNSPALKYAVVNNGNVLSTGSLKGTTSGSKVTILKNLYLEQTKQIYTVYVWLDNSEELGNISNESLSISVDCTASLQKEPAADTIISLYTNASKTAVTNNGKDYNTAPSVSLMNDRLGGTTTDLDDGNIRYYGASPNNYIYFNCSDYSNQTSSTCETWRIIGVFDGKLKLIRGSQIGKYSWDNKNKSTGAENNSGKNDWTTARLMKLLNPSDYYTVDSNDNNLGQSLYYNSASGKCYSGQNNATVDCDFTSTGIKNEETRNMIAETTYNLGGWNTFTVYPNEIYEYERGTTVYTGRPTTPWTGKIALAYPSDYGYAADLNQCKDKTLYDYNNSTCTSNNWMKAIITNNGSNSGWLLTPYSSTSGTVWAVRSLGGVGYGYSAYYAIGAVPVLSLSSKLGIESGDGSSSNPYKLSA